MNFDYDTAYFEAELASARSWFYICAVFSLLFFGGCIATAASRSSHDDWLPVILLGGISGLCLWASSAILALLWYFSRPDYETA